MTPSANHLPPKAAELFQTIQADYRHNGVGPLVAPRKPWFEFLLAVHEHRGIRLSGSEFYTFITAEQGWRNDLAQGLVAEYELAMQLFDFLAER